MRAAHYEILEDDASYYGEIPGFQGVWANAPTLEECRAELAEVLEGWLLFKLADGDPLPIVDGLELNVKRAA